jgi:cobalamin biosynthesis Mg chelatase CobN
MSASASASASAAPVKEMKSIPMKYLKYMSYGLYLLKRICPNPEEYAARSVELLNLNATVEEIVYNIDSIVDNQLQTEMHEIKTIRKNLSKPPKAAKKSAILKDKPLASAIIESAQQHTVEQIIAQSDSDNEHDDLSHVFGHPSPSETPVAKTKKIKIVNSPLVAEAEKAVHAALKNDEKEKKEQEKKKKEEEREQEKLRKEQEKLQKEQEKKKKDEEREQEKLRKEQEKQKKEQERASKVKSIVKPVAQSVVTDELVSEAEK